MIVVPHPPYSTDLAPCDFFLFPTLKLWMKGRRFKRNRSGYLTQFQKGTSRDASKHGRNAGTAVFVQKGSTLKVMEEFNVQGKQTYYKYCPGTFGYILVVMYSYTHCLGKMRTDSNKHINGKERDTASLLHR
jgi:hypothetical protein